MAPLVLASDLGTVRTLTLNEPGRRNPLGSAMLRALLAALAEVALDDAISVVVLRGAGPAFCAGHDLGEIHGHAPAEHAALFGLASELFLAVHALPQPVLAQVHGVAAGAGLQLVAACDLAVAADDATFAAPGVALGLLPSPPIAEIARALPRKHALDLLLSGEPLDAQAALARGLVSRVVPADELEDTVAALAARLGGYGPRTLRRGKEAYRHQLGLPLEEAYAYLTDVLLEHLAEAEARDGVAAFVERHRPG